jgi:16S rRNA (cytidine1402-2'-O)-methyltransferase
MSVCPLPLSGSRFEGFLPSRAGARRAALTALLESGQPVVFFEAPHRLRDCLLALQALAPERRVFIAREMTKRFETYLVGTPGMLVAEMDVAEQWRGEVVCVLEGAGEAGAGAGEQKRVMRILGGELPPAQAARIGAQILGVRKKDLYRLVSEND